MSTIEALGARGLPPNGRGIYVRESITDAQRIGANFAMVNAERSDADELARSLGGAWLYSLVGAWRPDTWRDGLAQILAKRRQLLAQGIPVHGIVADPEGGWPQLSAAQLASKVTALGQTLAALASEMRVGLTTYPSWPGRLALVAAAGDALWYSPQIYGRTSQDPADLARWYALWTSVAGPQHCIPTIAAWPVSPMHATAQGYHDYLAMLPAAAGYIAFDGMGRMPTHIADALLTYEPGGSALETAALGARNLLLRPAAIGIAVAIVVLVVLLVAGMAFIKRGG